MAATKEAQILCLKRFLETDNITPETLLKVFKKLGQIQMTVDLLQSTGIGKAVNGFRKQEGKVGERAKVLVTFWKNVVSNSITEAAQAKARAAAVAEEREAGKKHDLEVVDLVNEQARMEQLQKEIQGLKDIKDKLMKKPTHDISESDDDDDDEPVVPIYKVKKEKKATPSKPRPKPSPKKNHQAILDTLKDDDSDPDGPPPEKPYQPSAADIPALPVPSARKEQKPVKVKKARAKIFGKLYAEEPALFAPDSFQVVKKPKPKVDLPDFARKDSSPGPSYSPHKSENRSHKKSENSSPSLDSRRSHDRHREHHRDKHESHSSHNDKDGHRSRHSHENHSRSRESKSRDDKHKSRHENSDTNHERLKYRDQKNMEVHEVNIECFSSKFDSDRGSDSDRASKKLITKHRSDRRDSPHEVRHEREERANAKEHKSRHSHGAFKSKHVRNDELPDPNDHSLFGMFDSPTKSNRDPLFESLSKSTSDRDSSKSRDHESRHSHKSSKDRPHGSKHNSEHSGRESHSSSKHSSKRPASDTEYSDTASKKSKPDEISGHKKQKKSKKVADSEDLLDSDEAEGLSFEDFLNYDKKKHKKSSSKHKSKSSHATSGDSTPQDDGKDSDVMTSPSGRKFKPRRSTLTLGSLDIPPPTRQLSLSQNEILSILPQTQTVYKPMHFPEMDGQSRHSAARGDVSDMMIGTKKNNKTQVYSGRKTAVLSAVPRLYDACMQVLMDNIDCLEYIGGVPYDIICPVLEKCSASQLFTLEDFNPHLVEDSDELWKIHCQRDFKKHQPGELECWRELYLRLHDEREARLKKITSNISTAMAKKLPVRTTKLAFVDSVAKAPRDVRRKQQRMGTAGPMVVNLDPLAKLTSHGGGEGGNRIKYVKPSDVEIFRPQKAKPVAPMMAKTLKMIKKVRR